MKFVSVSLLAAYSELGFPGPTFCDSQVFKRTHITAQCPSLSNENLSTFCKDERPCQTDGIILVDIEAASLQAAWQLGDGGSCHCVVQADFFSSCLD